MSWREQVKPELEAIEAEIVSRLAWRGVSLESLRLFAPEEGSLQLAPALVLALGKYWGLSPLLTHKIAMATELSYLHFYVHRCVDNSESALSRQDAVLYGDYFAGLLFALLCEEDVFRYFGDFVIMLAVMNEGYYQSLKGKENGLSQEEFCQTHYRERGTFLGTPALIMALRAGLGEQEAEAVAACASELGLCWGARRENCAQLTCESVQRFEAAIERCPAPLPGPVFRDFQKIWQSGAPCCEA
jgi:geranylgeranyl pyrophosphate synthase